MAEWPTLDNLNPVGNFASEAKIKPTSSGQYAVSMFDKYSAPEYRDMYGFGSNPPSRSALNKLRNFNVNDATVFVTNEKPEVVGSRVTSKQTLEPGFWGSRTGNSPSGIRAIAQTIKDKVSALPRNELLSMKGYTPELNEQYGRLAQKMVPKQYFQGNQGGNYIAPQGMTAGVMRWLSKVLPGVSLTSIPQTANLYNNVKKYGDTAGYLKWLGAEPVQKWY